MKYEKIAWYTEENFRRITGIKKETFRKMVEIVRKSYEKNTRKSDGDYN